MSAQTSTRLVGQGRLVGGQSSSEDTGAFRARDAQARYLETKLFGSLDGLRGGGDHGCVSQHANGWHHVLWQNPDAGASD
jgi:hypothetical protein